ncbi:5'-nucleotidase C-terminal domain-containing protein [Caldalkalibacillus salinus]|uniref:5'-nucleotidase C-terminal domain-containing protein n=1 Tax=Caldalkalibacillus salinus TaxID=2803787 RepID=UPI001923DAF2|nr:5'-nucleotidase C-terminal domain-containing protein [Caldalkalibacillus salinus]
MLMNVYGKKAISIVVIFALVVSSLFVGTAGSPAFAQDNDTVTLTVVHTNDIHAQIEDFGKIAAYLQYVQRESSHYLYLDAGDIFSGNPVVDLQHGQPIVDLLNDMGLQTLTIGNHEFDYGPEHFQARMEESNFDWLSANTRIVNEEHPIEQPEPFEIYDVNGLSVGVLGLTETPPSTAPANIEGIAFDDPIETAKQYEYLRDEVDVFIALSHNGYHLDRQLAEEVTFFDAIIGGHSHTLLTQPAVVNGTPIAQAGANASHVGHLSFNVNVDTGDIDVTGFVQPVDELTDVDEAIQAKVDAYYEEAEEMLGQVIGYSHTGLTREGRTVRDVPLGNFWTDAMREYIQADIALTNNGGIRASIDPGEVTARDIYTVEPFANEIMEIRMTGQAIRDVIQYSYERRNQIDLQTSGLEYKIITNATGEYLDAELIVNDEPIDPEETYVVAVTDYIGSGGSGYDFQGEVVQAGAGFVTNAMLGYAQFLTDSGQYLDYETEGRISVEVDEEAPFPGEVIGETEHGLYSQNKTRTDAGLGNLYTDALRDQTQVDVALINNSSVLGEIPAGDITDEQIESLDPYKNDIVVVETTGQRIYDVILSQSNYHRGVDLQVSGLTYTLVADDEAEDGPFGAVDIQQIDGSDFDLNETYTVAYNDYMHGRDFYNLGQAVSDADDGKVWEATVAYIKQHDGPIDYHEGERITLEEQEAPEVTIREARDGGFDRDVTVTGVVTTDPGAWGARGFYLQDETAGTYVYQSAYDVQKGDRIQLTGTTSQYQGEFQISNVSQVDVLEEGDTLPTPIEVTPAQITKENEGELVCLTEVEITDLQQVNDFGTFEFVAAQEDESVLVRVDNRTGLAYEDFTFKNGEIVNVTGVSSQYQGTYQLKPRGTGDITLFVEEDQPNTTTFETLYEVVDRVSYRNKGAKKSLQRHIEKAAREWHKENNNKAMAQLEKIKQDLQSKDNRGLSREDKEELVQTINDLIDALQA